MKKVRSYNFIKYYFYLRYILFCRKFEVTLKKMNLFFIVIIIFYFLFLFNIDLSIDNSFLFLFIVISLLSFFQYNRKDYIFKKNNLNSQKKYITDFIESLIILIPLSILLIKTSFFFILILLFSLIFPFIKRTNSKSNLLPKYFSFITKKGDFEWKSGLRIYWIPLVFYFFLLLLSLIFKLNFYLTLIFIGLIILYLGHFYRHFEDISFIKMYRGLRSETFIFIKIRQLIRNYNMIIIPFLTFSCLVYLNKIDVYAIIICLLFYLQHLLFLIYSLILKYTNLESSDMEYTKKQSNLYFLNIIPFSFPITLIFIYFSYKIANQNLRKYLIYD